MKKSIILLLTFALGYAASWLPLPVPRSEAPQRENQLSLAEYHQRIGKPVQNATAASPPDSAFRIPHSAFESLRTPHWNWLVTPAHAQTTIYSYDYPQVRRESEGGYTFNMITRIIKDVGIEPFNTSDVQFGGVWRTVIDFTVALTAPQKAALDALMANDPCFPPTPTGTRYVSLDLYENRALLRTKFNKTFWIWWQESVPGSGSFDRVLIYFDDVLTTGNRNTVASEYSKLLSLISVTP
jgi:hypothetical protein